MSHSELPDPVLPLGYPKRNASGDTSSWSAHHPAVDYHLCIKCKTCILVCPEGAIKLANEGEHEGFPQIDYTVCKGCMVCRHECPKNALDGDIESQ